MNNDWSKALKRTPECAELDEIIARLEGRRGPVSQRKAETHVATCAHCSTELALYREFESAQPGPEEHPHVQAIMARLKQNSPIPSVALPSATLASNVTPSDVAQAVLRPLRPAFWKSLWNWKILVPASIGLASASLVLTIWNPPSHRPTPDFTGQESVYRSAKILAISPAAVVHESPQLFTWQPVAGAATYRIRVYEVDNTQLWTSIVTAPKASLPLSISNRLIAPKAIHWQVLALNASGAIIADTGTQTTAIK